MFSANIYERKKISIYYTFNETEIDHSKIGDPNSDLHLYNVIDHDQNH